MTFAARIGGARNETFCVTELLLFDCLIGTVFCLNINGFINDGRTIQYEGTKGTFVSSSKNVGETFAFPNSTLSAIGIR
jgi:hypothetical protein